MRLKLRWHNTRAAHGPMIGKGAGIALLLVGMAAGCAKPAGVIFPAPAQPILWPGGEEPARIRYVGQLMTDADLKPAVPFTKRLGNMLFGKPAIQAMLSPFALCTDGGDRLFVADSNAQLVHMFDLRTRRYERWRPSGGSGFSQPVGVAYDPQGRLFVADSVSAVIHVFDRTGRYEGAIGEGILTRPAGLAFDPTSRRLFVADVAAHQIVILSPQGQELHRLGRRGAGLGEFNFPTNVALDRAGRLYVSDTLNFRIQQFDANLKFTRQIGGKGDAPGYLSQPKGIAADSDDHLYIVDAHFEAVQIFNADGALLLAFGQEGVAPGEFWLPAGIYIDPHDRIWVADGYNRRVQVFDYLAEGGR